MNLTPVVEDGNICFQYNEVSSRTPRLSSTPAVKFGNIFYQFFINIFPPDKWKVFFTLDMRLEHERFCTHDYISLKLITIFQVSPSIKAQHQTDCVGGVRRPSLGSFRPNNPPSLHISCTQFLFSYISLCHKLRPLLSQR